MARINYGFGISSIAGNIGGACHAFNRYGRFIRPASIKVKTRSTLQQEQRSFLSRLIQLWQSLTDSQRAQWETYSEFYVSFPTNGQTTRLDGYHVFLEINLNLLQVDQNLITSPVWSSIVTTIQVSAIVSSGSAFYLDLSSAQDFTNNIPLVNCTYPFSKSTMVPGKRFTWVQHTTPSNTRVSIFAGFTDRFGAVQPIGTKVFVKLCLINKNTGFRSNSQELSIIRLS